MAELIEFPPVNWVPVSGIRARRRTLNRIEAWHARSRDDMRRLNAPPDVLEDLAIIAAKLRARAYTPGGPPWPTHNARLT